MKTIKFDRLTKDYAAYLNGELVGYFASYSEAEAELDRLVFEAPRGITRPERGHATR